MIQELKEDAINHWNEMVKNPINTQIIMEWMSKFYISHSDLNQFNGDNVTFIPCYTPIQLQSETIIAYLTIWTDKHQNQGVLIETPIKLPKGLIRETFDEIVLKILKSPNPLIIEGEKSQEGITLCNIRLEELYWNNKFTGESDNVIRKNLLGD